MHGKPQPQSSKFVGGRPFAKPEAAAQELLRIYREFLALRPDYGHTYTGVTNSAFTKNGGSIEEYSAGVKHGIEAGLFRIDESGTRVFVLAESTTSTV